MAFSALNRLIFYLSTLIIFSAAALGQYTLGFGAEGLALGDQMGLAVANAGDVDGDGNADVIVGSPYEAVGGVSPGVARVYSGTDGSLLYTLSNGTHQAWFGYAVGGGFDANDDGFDDFVVGAPFDDTFGLNHGSARIYSGADGTILHTVAGDTDGAVLGISVSGAGDVNQDGFGDVVIGASGNNSFLGGIQFGGRVQVVSGFDGSVILDRAGNQQLLQLGFDVDGAGDINGDGFDDIIAGAPGLSTNGLFRNGGAVIYSGADSTILFLFQGSDTEDFFGQRVAGLGDVDADGKPDVIVATISDDTAGTDAGNSQVFSGADGSLLYSIDGATQLQRSGHDVDTAGDFDGDGHADFLIGALNGGIASHSGSVSVYSGFDGSLLYTLIGASAASEFGYAVAGGADYNGDGAPDVVVGSPKSDELAQESGRFQVFLGISGPVTEYTTTTALPHFLSVSWLPTGGLASALDGQLACTGATPFSQGLVYASLNTFNTVAFGFLPVLIDPDPAVLLVSEPFVFNGSGSLTTFVSRQNPALGGLDVFIQIFEVTPLVLSSNGIRMTVAP